MVVTAELVLVTAVGGALMYLLTTYVNNLYLSPLAKYPGPTIWAMFRAPFAISMVSGNLPHRVKAMHDRYGDIVRVAPDELSFIGPNAWQDIFGNRAGRKMYDRPFMWKKGLPGSNLFSANDEDHARFRKALAPAFSEKAMKDHEAVVHSYVDILISQLRKHAGTPGSPPLDLVKWLNLTAFDIIGDLSFGESFGCLEQGEYHPWVETIRRTKGLTFSIAADYWRPLATIMQLITPKSVLKSLDNLIAITKDKVGRRLQAGPGARPDIITHLTKEKKGSSEGLSPAEIEGNSVILVIAGSETVTTTLVGILGSLLKDPLRYQKVVKELRSSFVKESEIKGSSVARLPYITATLQEGLRACPPVPDGLRRLVPEGGDTVCGEFLPGGVTVGISQWPMYMSSRNFRNPESFIPERWLPGDEYADDRKVVFQPFAIGKRDCLGQNLGWVELRVMFARLLWNFDLEIPAGGTIIDWGKQEIFFNWDKQPLNVVLKDIRQE